MQQQKKKLVPPDGGWGWVIVFAYALNSVILFPILQNFGLIFKDTFIKMGFSATDGSIIINTNAACGLLTGFINGALLKYYGYRKVSIAGAFFTTVGIILTAYADSFIWFLISYGFITSLGIGMGMSAYSLALHSYFLKRRSKAMGITMTMTGVGPVIMPQLMSLLMILYDVKGAVLIIGGIASHSFVAGILLQPLKWHLVDEIIDEEEAKDEIEKFITEDDKLITLQESDTNQNRKPVLDKQHSVLQSTRSIDNDLEVHAIYGFDTPLAGSALSLNQGRNRKYSTSSYLSATADQSIINQWLSSASINKFEINNNGQLAQSVCQDSSLLVNSQENQSENEETIYKSELSAKIPEEEDPDLFRRILIIIVKIFDLNLLKDPVYVNLMLGMSLASFADQNFSLLTPFILADFNLSTPQSAMFLSVLSIADILFRFLSPFIGDFLNKPARIMYMFSLVLLILTRSMLLLFEEYTQLLVIAGALGIAKGIRTVYAALVIPNYVTIDRLASASGIQMVFNGLFILIGGPLLGVIRDVSGSYKKAIIVINTATACTLTMWIVEMLLARFKARKTKNTELAAK